MTILRTWKKGEKIQHTNFCRFRCASDTSLQQKLLNLKTSEINIVQAGRGLSFAAQILLFLNAHFIERTRMKDIFATTCISRPHLVTQQPLKDPNVPHFIIENFQQILHLDSISEICLNRRQVQRLILLYFSHTLTQIQARCATT